MKMLGKFVSGLFQTTLRILPNSHVNMPVNGSLNIATEWSGMSVRNRVRNHFPHPNERRRILRHGWKARMSTLGGRKVLMRRILKGYTVLSH